MDIPRKRKRSVFAPYALNLHLPAKIIDEAAVAISDSTPEPAKEKDDDFWTYDMELVASFAEVDARFTALRVWRLAVARENSWSTWAVFSDEQLTAIADANPSNLNELGQVPDISSEKLSCYGQDVLKTLSK